MIRICNIPKIFMHKYHNSPINYVVYIYINPDKNRKYLSFQWLKIFTFYRNISFL